MLARRLAGCLFAASVIGASVVTCGGTTTDDDAGADVGFDVHHADVVTIDTSIADASDDGPACAPQLPDGYVPVFIPSRQPENACSTMQIQSFYDACVGTSSSSGTCASFEANTANDACIECVETPLGASVNGAAITWHGGASIVANVAGCMAIVSDDFGPSGCPAKYETWQQCILDACGGCPQGTYEDCSSAAESGPCAPSEGLATTCLAEPTYAICNQTSFEDYFTTYGALLCTTSASDAGDD